MKRCPKCNKRYDDTWEICINCKVPLIAIEAGVEERLSRLESQARQILNEIEEMRTGKIAAPKPAEPKPVSLVKKPPIEKPSVLPEKKEDTEVLIGKYILSKIGVASMVAGIAFLIAYTFRYLMPVHKIIIGFAISGAMLYYGSKIERNEKFKWYGRGLIGGGWSLAYFTTFAMHHIPATRIIHSQLLDLIFLSAVVSAMIVHLFKYRSQSVLAITLFLGYLTAGMSTVGYFTFIYITLLAIATIFLTYKMNWQGMAFFSLVGTYFTHMIWIVPQIYRARPTLQIEPFKFWLSVGFIAVYWILYNIIPFIMKIKNEDDVLTINGFILINSFLFGLLGFFEVHLYNPDWRFNFAIISALAVAALGLISRYSINKDRISTTYYLTSIAFATSSLSFKLDRTLVNFIWLAEIPLLIYLGIKLIGKILYRIAAWILSLVMIFKLLYLLNAPKTLVEFMGKELSVRLFVFAAGIISFYLIRYLYLYNDEKNTYFDQKEIAASNIYTFIGTAFLLLMPAMEVQRNLVTLNWAISSFLLFTIGFLIKDRFSRYAALSSIALAILRVVSVDLAGVNTIYRILVFIGLGMILLIASYWYTRISGATPKEEK